MSTNVYLDVTKKASQSNIYPDNICWNLIVYYLFHGGKYFWSPLIKSVSRPPEGLQPAEGKPALWRVVTCVSAVRGNPGHQGVAECLWGIAEVCALTSSRGIGPSDEQ